MICRLQKRLAYTRIATNDEIYFRTLLDIKPRRTT